MFARNLEMYLQEIFNPTGVQSITLRHGRDTWVYVKTVRKKIPVRRIKLKILAKIKIYQPTFSHLIKNYFIINKSDINCLLIYLIKNTKQKRKLDEIVFCCFIFVLLFSDHSSSGWIKTFRDWRKVRMPMEWERKLFLLRGQ